MRLLIVFLFFQVSSAASAQQWCGFNDIVLNHTHPEVPVSSTKRNSLNVPKVIPTIVHILHEGEPYGVYPHISSEIVYQAIDSVNVWFEQSDAALELCIASVGPDGEATSGIIYHNVLTEFPDYNFSNNAQDYYSYVQNNTLVAPSEYLNIYVDNWSSGPLGFATLPTGPTCWVRTNQFDNPESTTLIHEVGHWCGLYHTFQDLSSSPGGYDDCETAAAETNCETQGDRVCDTPPTVLSFNCAPACPDDVIESYMSYAPDNCQTLFTPGQVDRMHAQLESLRPGVVNNNVACGNADVDLAVISFTNNNPECDTYLDPSITIKNFGLDGEFFINYSLQVLDSNFQTVYSEADFGSYSLAQDEIIEIFFDPYTFQFGDYTVIANVTTSDDGWEFNNTLTQDLPLQPFTEINVVYYDAFSPSTQFRIYEWDPETGNHIPGVIASCNWGGPQCWEYGFFEEEDWPIEWSYCLQPGCYELWWRWTSNSNLDCELATLLGYENCYVDIQLSNGEQLYYADTLIEENGILEFQFCVEAPDPCPITECPTDLDGDGITGNIDLLQFLSLVGQTGECLEGDFNFDGEVTFLDLALFLNQYGYDCNGDIIIGDNLIEGSDAMLYETMDVLLHEHGNYITQSVIFDIHGRRVNDKGTLPDGIYIIKQYWDNGFITTKKLYLNTWR